MTYKELELLIKVTTEALKEATTIHHKTGLALAEAKLELEKQELLLIKAGVEGKNDKERKANMQQSLSTWIENSEIAEIGHAEKIHDLAIARIDYDYMRYMLRLMEVEAKSGS